MIASILATGNTGVERLRGLGDHFKEPDPHAPLQILVAVLAILAIFLIMRLLKRIENRRLDSARAQPMSLYWRVQAHMGLSLLDRWRLYRLARTAGMSNPTALLISPTLFDRAVERYPAGSSRAAQLAGIRRRVFGQAAPLPIESVRAG